MRHPQLRQVVLRFPLVPQRLVSSQRLKLMHNPRFLSLRPLLVPLQHPVLFHLSLRQELLNLLSHYRQELLPAWLRRSHLGK